MGKLTLLMLVPALLLVACEALGTSTDLEATVGAAVAKALDERAAPDISIDQEGVDTAAQSGTSGRVQSSDSDFGITEEGALAARGTISNVNMPFASIASRSFIKLGDIKGESRDQDHRDEIDILSWQWGVTPPSETGGDLAETAGGTGAASTGPTGEITEPDSGVSGAEIGVVDVQEFQIIKHFDKASPKLYQALANKEVIPDVTLTVRAEENQRIEYLLIKMTNVMVTSVTIGGSGGDRPIETITFSFAKIEVRYQPLDSEGEAIGEPGGFELLKMKHDTAKAAINNVR